MKALIYQNICVDKRNTSPGDDLIKLKKTKIISARTSQAQKKAC